MTGHEWREAVTVSSGFEADLAIARLEAAGIRAVRDDNDTVGIPDPNPDECGYGSFAEVPQVEVPIPFAYWLIYRQFVLSNGSGIQPSSVDEAVCGLEPVRK